MTDWVSDLSQAPRGKTWIETVPAGVDEHGYEKVMAIRKTLVEWIWAATRKGEVIRTHWLPADGKHRPNGRWLNLATDEQPVAWQPYVVPSHPGIPEQGERG